MADDGQMPINEIKVGDTTYVIPRFKGLKATIASALASRVMRELPELQDRAMAARKEFREKNTTVVTRSLAKTEQFATLGLTDEDFNNAEGGVIEFPEEPSNQWLAAKMFPDLFALADKEVRKFLALIVISNRELEDADDADTVDEALAIKGKRLIREGDIDELLELFVVGLEVLKEQLASKRDRLGKLRIPLLQMLLREDSETDPTQGDQTEENPSGEIPMETSPSVQETLQPNSSTDSQEPTDGAEETSSTESLGVS